MKRPTESPLEKARGAVARVKELLDGAELDAAGLLPMQVHDEAVRLLQIANVQAQISQAESLAALVDRLGENARAFA